MSTQQKRVSELKPGDLTSHAGGACTCVRPDAPFRVEDLTTWDYGITIEVIWSHPACGTTHAPLACSPDCLVTFYDSGVAP